MYFVKTLFSIALVFIYAYFCTSFKVNRWRKRGISVVPLKFGLGWSGAPYTVLVSIYATDGTVAVTHGGVEVGQGINTKVRGTDVVYYMFMCWTGELSYVQVAQVAAKTLGISIDMIKIKPSNSLTNPNGMTTGGSISSELACLVSVHVVCICRSHFCCLYSICSIFCLQCTCTCMCHVHVCWVLHSNVLHVIANLLLTLFWHLCNPLIY